MFLSKEQILEAQDRRYAEVDVPEWGGKVRLASLDADQTLAQEALMKKRQAGDETVNPLTSMLSAAIVDENGKQLFTLKDVEALGRKNPRVLIRLIAVFKDLNRNPADAKDDDTEEVPELGNSVASPAEGSPSVSA